MGKGRTSRKRRPYPRLCAELTAYEQAILRRNTRAMRETAELALNTRNADLLNELGKKLPRGRKAKLKKILGIK